MNFIGIDVSQGKSHATQITDEFEKRRLFLFIIKADLMIYLSTLRWILA